MTSPCPLVVLSVVCICCFYLLFAFVLAVNMRLCVLGSPDGWYFRDLTRAAAGRHEVIGLPFSRIWAECPDNSAPARFAVGDAPFVVGDAPLGVGPAQSAGGGAALDDFDAILVRSMPPGSLEQVVFRMDVLGCLERAGVEVLNPPRTLEMAVDKYLATARMQQAGLPTPATWVGQAGDEAMEAFERLGGDVVIKPLFGSEGRGIMRVDDEALAWRTTRSLAQLGAVIYMQKFVVHAGHDIRILVIGDQTLAIKRTNDQDWRTNVSRGARAEPYEASSIEIDLARRAAQVLQAPLAGVDILPGSDGCLYVLEVNAVPGWRGLARALRLDVAAHVLSFVESRVTARRDQPHSPR